MRLRAVGDLFSEEMEPVRKFQRSVETVPVSSDLLVRPRSAGRLQRCFKLVGEPLLRVVEHLNACFYSLGDLSGANPHGNDRPWCVHLQISSGRWAVPSRSAASSARLRTASGSWGKCGWFAQLKEHS